MAICCSQGIPNKESESIVRKTIRNLIVWVGFCALGLPTPGMASTIFSFNGIGDVVRRVDVRAIGMGGAGRAVIDGQNFSAANPALLASFRRPAARGIFFVQRRAVEDARGQKRSIADGDFGGLQVTLPLRHGTVLGFGLEPMTDLDFGLIDSVGTGAFPYALSVTGSGGIQSISLGVGQRIGKRLYVGGRVDLAVLGTLTEAWTKDFEDSELYFSEDTVIRTHRGAVPAVGAVYTAGSWSLGASVQLESNIRQTQRLRNVFTERRVLDLEVQSEIDVTMPFIMGGGVAYASADKWIVSADAEWAAWSKTEDGRHDTMDLACGVLFRTGRRDLLVQRRRLELLAGMHYRSLYFRTASGNQIAEKGASLGFSWPFKHSSGVFRYAIEVGKRGDVARDGASEHFIRQSFSISGWVR